MANETTTIPLTRTKLHRPPVPSDHVHRARLLERLEERRYRPLTVVSAPAGYGKSTLVSCWLDRCESPFAWLSLDEHDNELHQFLTYFLTAVRTMFPDAVNKTMTLVNAPTLPPIPVLVNSLANELDSIELDFVLVLDDIHCIQEKSVHDLLKMLLHHPPRPMHLVLIGRRDPPLPMPKLRGRGQITEIRTLDLSFTAVETAKFLKIALEEEVDESTAAALAERTEGWVTSLRLAVLAVRGHHNAVSKLLELKGTAAYVMDYLITEVLDVQPPVIRRNLLSTSILDRFCAPLCDALGGLDSEVGEGEIDGQGFVTSVQQGDLLVIPLDTENRWFRYHHLFQHLLQDQLKLRYSAEGIATLHSRASEWFESQGLITESIEHALAAEDPVRAAEIVERHRLFEDNQDRWYVVGRWLDLLPPEIVQQRPALLLIQAWQRFNQFRLSEVPALLERVQSLISDTTVDESLLGELDFHWGYLSIWAQGDGAGALKRLERARSRLSDAQRVLVAETEFDLALARHMAGEGKLATASLEGRIKTTSLDDVLTLTRLFGAQAFVFLMSGNLSRAARAARQMRTIAEEGHNVDVVAWGDYLLALIDLQSFRLEEALRGFLLVAERRRIVHRKAAVDALAGLVLAYQAMRRMEDSLGAAKQLLEFAQESGDPQFVAVAESCRARLALLQGDLESATSWAQSFEAEPRAIDSVFWLEVPLITRARVQIELGTNESLERALQLLTSLRQQGAALHFTCLTIEISVCRTLALEKLGRSDEALTALEEAVALAGPGGWIRPFVEAGPPMADLLKRLTTKKVAVDYIEKLLAAFENDKQVAAADVQATPMPSLGAPSPHPPVSSSPRPQPLVDPLTDRELRILELLAQRLQNKEIAEELFISPATVKSHLKNIYQKLQVSNRREAVTRAKDLGILSRH